MNSKTRLESAVFQLTPTRTRCDLYIIAQDKKEKIASGLLNPFVAHLKAAQDQIAEGGYSILLVPEAGSNATWFTKRTVESFVRFVSTPEILERVYTIESEIQQIEEAISIQENKDISIKGKYVKPVSSNEGNKPACDVEAEEKAIVLYEPGAHDLTSSSAKETNSKVQLINVLESRKTVLKKEQGMAFARAVAAGFEIEHVANLLSFAECFGASRLMSGCLRFIDLWKQKHESGQWVEIEAEDTIPDCFASGIVLSSMANEPRGGDAISEAAGSNASIADGGEQQYQPPWGMHSSPHGGVPVYQAYPMPYYQHYPGFYPPPSPIPPYPSSSSIEDPSHFHKRQSMDNNIRYTNYESEIVNEEESSDQHKSAGKKKSGRVVIRNINFINSKIPTTSESASSSETDIGDHTTQQKRNPKRKGNRGDSKSETLDAKDTDWGAFQTYLLKSAVEGGGGDMFAMEKDNKTKTRQKTYDDNMVVSRREETNVRDSSGFEETATLDKRNGLQHDEAVMVSLRSTSDFNNNNDITGDLKRFENKSSHKPLDIVKYEPDALSLMPERDVENTGYDPAIDCEMQLAAALHEKTSKQDKKVSKHTPHQLSKPSQGVVRKGRPSMVNNKNNLEEARARADKLRSYKADLQKMKKEQQDAEQKRLEALKMERQKRISARTSRKQLPSSSKLSPISQTRKFTDSDPGSSSPLQRSKVRPTSLDNSKKPSSSSSKLIGRNQSTAGSRMTRSLSDTKKEMNTITPTDSLKVLSSSITRIRRLSEPKKINTTPYTTKTRSAEPVSKPKSFIETQKVPAELKKKVTISSDLMSQKGKVMVKPPASQVANNRLSDADSNPVVDKTVVMLEHDNNNKKLSSIIMNTGMNTGKVPLPMETVDKGAISVHPQKHPTSSSEQQQQEVCVSVEEEGGKKYEAPYARVSSFEDQSTRNSEYAKAPRNQPNLKNATEKAYVPNLNNIPETQSKGGAGGRFRRLLKLGKKTPPPLPQVGTLKSFISSEDQAPTPPQNSSRNLFSFQFRGEKKPTSFVS